MFNRYLIFALVFLVSSFENKTGKYRLVQLDDRAPNKKLSEVDFNLESSHKSKLPTYVQDLIKEIVSSIPQCSKYGQKFAN